MKFAIPHPHPRLFLWAATRPLRGALGLGALLLAAAAPAAAQPAPPAAWIEQARVLSSTPLVEQGRVTGYTVEYEVDGRRFATLMAQAPGPTLPVRVSPMGVSTLPEATSPPPWSQVQPEPGVVVSPEGLPYGPSYGPPYGPSHGPSYHPSYHPSYDPAYGAPPPGMYAAPAYAPPPPRWVYPRPSVSLGLGYAGGGRSRWGLGLGLGPFFPWP